MQWHRHADAHAYTLNLSMQVWVHEHLTSQGFYPKKETISFNLLSLKRIILNQTKQKEIKTGSPCDTLHLTHCPWTDYKLCEYDW